MLTKVEAEKLVLTRLSSRDITEELSIAQFNISERAFGWVFQFSVVTALPRATSATETPRMLIVNKHSGQVVASHIEYELGQFVRRYEKLLSQNQARSQGWCGTLPLPFPWSLWRKRTVAERAKEGGFYEIGVKEGEP